MKNTAAVALGRRARGVPKNYTPEELAKRTDRLKGARAAKAALHPIAISTRRVRVETKVGTHFVMYVDRVKGQHYCAAQFDHHIKTFDEVRQWAAARFTLID